MVQTAGVLYATADLVGAAPGHTLPAGLDPWEACVTVLDVAAEVAAVVDGEDLAQLRR
jgi:hypothetical protein